MKHPSQHKFEVLLEGMWLRGMNGYYNRDGVWIGPWTALWTGIWILILASQGLGTTQESPHAAAAGRLLSQLCITKCLKVLRRASC